MPDNIISGICNIYIQGECRMPKVLEIQNTIKSRRSPKSNFRASALTWFIRYIHYCMLQFLHNVIINKTKVLRPQAEMTIADFAYPF